MKLNEIVAVIQAAESAAALRQISGQYSDSGWLSPGRIFKMAAYEREYLEVMAQLETGVEPQVAAELLERFNRDATMRTMIRNWLEWRENAALLGMLLEHPRPKAIHALPESAAEAALEFLEDLEQKPDLEQKLAACKTVCEARALYYEFDGHLEDLCHRRWMQLANEHALEVLLHTQSSRLAYDHGEAAPEGGLASLLWSVRAEELEVIEVARGSSGDSQ